MTINTENIEDIWRNILLSFMLHFFSEKQNNKIIIKKTTPQLK